MNREDSNLPEQLAEEAHAALRDSGARLLDRLESMRRTEAIDATLEPLHPQAALALRQHGDQLLAQLEQRRSQEVLEETPSPEAPAKRRVVALSRLFGFGAAAALAFFAVKIAITPPAKPESPDLSATVAAEQAPSGVPGELQHSPAIPEPSSSLLTLVAGAWLLGRRRR